jgi:hypothetical protein
MLRNEDGSPLRSYQILDWLLNLSARLKDEGNPHTIVGFGLGYDAAMWFKDLPERPAWRLYAPHRVGWVDHKGMPRWANFGPYLFRFIGSEIAICESAKGLGARATTDTRKSVTVWDTMKFFQSSFVVALEKWKILGKRELDAIERMKRKRSTFEATNITDEVIRYCFAECRAGVKLISKLNETCKSLGYPLTRFDGAGSLAAAMLKAWRIKDYLEPVPDKMRHAVSVAYSGGWFENAWLGLITRAVTQWDINSAYPWVIQSLPCLKHAEWKASKTVHSEGLYEVDFKYPDPCYWGALPIRSSRGEITHPTNGKGWYYGSEILAAEALYPGSHNILRGWTLIRHCDHVPFSRVPDVYRERLRLGKSAAGMVLKLGLNSLYGKTAQSIGEPAYASYIWAGMITAGCRAKILEAMAIAGPENVTAVATDAIYTVVPINLPSSPEKRLGDWDATTYPGGIMAIQPGVTISYDAEGRGEYKSRGLGKSEFAAHSGAAITAWKRMGIFGSFRASTHRFIGIRAALARGKYGDRCRWVTHSGTLQFRPRYKRSVPDRELIAHKERRPAITLAPSGRDEPSQPYKLIQRRLMDTGYGESVLTLEQPSPDCELLELAAFYGKG